MLLNVETPQYVPVYASSWPEAHLDFSRKLPLWPRCSHPLSPFQIGSSFLDLYLKQAQTVPFSRLYNSLFFGSKSSLSFLSCWLLVQCPAFPESLFLSGKPCLPFSSLLLPSPKYSYRSQYTLFFKSAVVWYALRYIFMKHSSVSYSGWF